MERAELELLRGTFLFRGLAAGEVEKALEAGRHERRAYARGEVVYSPESFRRELGILLRGSLTVTKGALTVSELTAGDVAKQRLTTRLAAAVLKLAAPLM